MYIRKEKKSILPDMENYVRCVLGRLDQMKNVNKQFEASSKPYWSRT